MTYLMEIDNLGKRYDDFELSGVSLAVEPGCVVGFFAPGEARILRHDYGYDVLAPDRFAFARAFPDIPVDKATIEDYMTLTLKGESR